MTKNMYTYICILYILIFRVEGKIFYGHKIVLVTASPRFQSMLSSKLSEENTPTVQINDIRYHIFQVSTNFTFNDNVSIKLNLLFFLMHHFHFHMVM